MASEGGHQRYALRATARRRAGVEASSLPAMVTVHRDHTVVASFGDGRPDAVFTQLAELLARHRLVALDLEPIDEPPSVPHEVSAGYLAQRLRDLADHLSSSSVRDEDAQTLLRDVLQLVHKTSRLSLVRQVAMRKARSRAPSDTAPTRLMRSR